MRREFSAKTKVLAFQRSGGRCEGILANGKRCGLKLQTCRITFDHRIPDQLGGEPTLQNCQVLGWCCDRPKTKTDQGNIAKAKRRERKHVGIRKPRSITRWRKFNGDAVIVSRHR